MLEVMTQAQNARNHDIDMMVQSLRSHHLASSDVGNHSVRAEESCCFGTQGSISAQSFELAQTPNFESDIDSLASYPFPEIELENEYDHEPQLSDSILLPDSIMTPVSSPDFDPFPESVLDPVPIHCEIETPIIYDDHIELDQFHTFESPIDKLASSHFCGIELNEECDFDPPICDLVQIPESLLTPVLLPNLSNILESVLIPIPIILELESPILESHIPL